MKKLIDRHHAVPKSRLKAGDWKSVNSTPLLEKAKIRMSRVRHEAFHTFFKNMTLDEAILFLQRLRSLTVRKVVKNRKKKARIVPLKDSYFVPVANKTPLRKTSEQY